MGDKVGMKDWGALEALNKAWAQDDKHKADYFKHILNSVIRDGERSATSIADRVKEWVLTTDGEWFYCRDTYDALQLQLGPPRQAAYQTLLRLREKGEIEKDFKITGRYRRVVVDAPIMDWESASGDEYKIHWPLGVGEKVEVYPGELVLLAGEKNSAKTGFLMNLAYLNQGDYNVNYSHSELNKNQLYKRIMNSVRYGNTDIEVWRDIVFRERLMDFAPLLRVDDFNICDYVHRTTEFAMMGDDIENIYQKMYGNKGLVVVATQKHSGKEWGLGGQTTLARPNLYLTMTEGDMASGSPHKIKIKIAKSPRDGRSAKNMSREFLVHGNGTVLESVSPWAYEKEDYSQKSYFGGY